MTKKDFLLLILVVVLLSSIVSAQGIVGKGVKAGLNFATMRGDDVDEAKMKMGLAFGGYMTYALNTNFAIQPEIFYSMKGFKVEDEDEGLTIKGTTSLNYLEIPILAVYSLQKDIKIFAGPSIGFFMNGKTKMEMKGEFMGVSFDEEDSEDIDSDEVNSPEFALVLGGTYSFGTISLDARYSLGLTNVPDDADDDFEMKNSVIQLILGYSF